MRCKIETTVRYATADQYQPSPPRTVGMGEPRCLKRELRDGGHVGVLVPCR